MTKLHEVLAVESTKEKVANKLIKESLHTLDKESLFSGAHRKLEMFAAEDKNAETEEFQELTSTVDENLDYLVDPIAEWLDVVLAKDLTNQTASNSLEIDGQVLATDVPATFLLGLETKLSKIREVYEKIPTLAPGVKWVADVQNRPGVYVTEHSSIQLKTEKNPEFRVVYEATKEHPAQIKEVNRTQNTGRYITTLYSGKMTPLEKANRLNRIDKLLSVVKMARMRANNVDIVTKNIGKKIMDYINKG